MRCISNHFYLILLGIIIPWWWLAFHLEWQHSSPLLLAQYEFPEIADLSILDRSLLHRALSGDVALMSRFVRNWNDDATILKNRGISGIEQLPNDAYTFSQHFPALPRESDRLSQRFLPHTHFAATLLLTLLPPSHIVALPSGMRNQKDLYSQELMQQIPLNAERYCNEQIYQQSPNCAFVASYSDPAMLKMLKKQGINLSVVNPITALSDIEAPLLKIGRICQCPLKARFLMIFMKAAMMNLDNRLRALGQERRGSSSLVYVNAYHQLSIPTTKSLNGQLLKRACSQYGIATCPIPESDSAWSIPFGQEQIRLVNPDYLIISTMHRSRKLDFDKPTFYLDAVIQDSPTQYLVLAYFDICTILSLAGREII